MKNQIKQNPFLKVFLLFLGFVILIQGIGLISYSLNSERLHSVDPWQPSFSNSKVPVLARWDSGWYISVIKYGYSFNSHIQSTSAFFPLYPILIKSLGGLLPTNYFYVGQIISWFALFLCLIFFYKLLCLDYSASNSFKILFYFLIFPWSFFLAAVYTESLFLLLVFTSFYYARKQNWIVAGILGFFSCLTRVTGIFLFPALLYEYWQQNKKFNSKTLWLFLTPLGLFMFMFFLKIKTGYFFSFVYSQAAFNRNLALPFLSFWTDTKTIFYYLKHGELLKGLTYGLPFLAIATGVYLFTKKFKEIRLSYVIFASLTILPSLLTSTTTSLGRYLLSAFPIFIAASLIENKFFKYTWFGIGLAFLLIFTFYFVGWYFVV